MCELPPTHFCGDWVLWVIRPHMPCFVWLSFIPAVSGARHLFAPIPARNHRKENPRGFAVTATDFLIPNNSGKANETEYPRSLSVCFVRDQIPNIGAPSKKTAGKSMPYALFEALNV